MGKIAICAADANERAVYLQNRDLPVYYMEDFSLMGFVVSNYDEATLLLTEQGYRLEKVEGGADVVIDSPSQLLEIEQSLADNGISCAWTDIVDTLYQA